MFPCCLSFCALFNQFPPPSPPPSPVRARLRKSAVSSWRLKRRRLLPVPRQENAEINILESMPQNVARGKHGATRDASTGRMLESMARTANPVTRCFLIVFVREKMTRRFIHEEFVDTESLQGVGFEHPLRPVFKSSIWKNGPCLWEIWTSKGHSEVNISSGSGIRDPRFEISWIEIMRTDRMQR